MDATWRPSYDIRVSSKEPIVNFSCIGEVYLSPGHEWKNVKLTLSTGQSSLMMSPPELAPESLTLESKVRAKTLKSPSKVESHWSMSSLMVDVTSPVSFSSTLKSNRAEYLSLKLPAKFHHSVTPKLR